MSTTSLTTVIPSKYRWVVLAACWGSFTLTSIDRSTWGPAAVFVGAGLNVPLASLGAFATAYYIGYVVSNSVGGVFADAVGGRVTLTVSLFGAGAFMIIFGSTGNAVLGVGVQALVGLFAGADYAAGVRLITSWFRPDELGLVLGVFLTATSIGLGIANAVVPSLIAWHSWETSYHLFGVISIVFSIVLLFIAKPGPLDVSHRARKADGRGALPNLLLLVRNRNLVVVCLAGFGGFWGIYGFAGWANALMIKGHQIPPQMAGLVIVVFSVTAAVSKPLVGFIVGKYFYRQRKALTLALMGVYGLGLIAFGSLASVQSFLWIAALLGLVAYGSTTLMIVLVPTLVPQTVTGTAAGTTNAIWQLGSMIVPTVVGAVFAGTGSFLVAFATLAIGPLLGMALLFLLRLTKQTAPGMGQQSRTLHEDRSSGHERP
jgi:ACS family glucarate transporter-like MFS transporter